MSRDNPQKYKVTSLRLGVKKVYSAAADPLIRRLEAQNVYNMFRKKET